MKTTKVTIEITYEDGEEIDMPDWVRDFCQVKREPKIIFVNEYEDEVVGHFNKNIAIEKAAPGYVARTAVKYKEVIE